MFVLTSVEMENWKSQIVISNKENMGLRKLPLVFTEQGVAMLSSVLNSDKHKYPGLLVYVSDHFSDHLVFCTKA